MAQHYRGAGRSSTVPGTLNFPLVTDRFVLTPLGTADRTAFTTYRRDLAVARFQSWTPDWSDGDTDALIAAQPPRLLPQSGDWLQIAVRERNTNTLVGDVAVHALADQPDTYEFGVTLALAWQGIGAAQEALGRLADTLFGEQDAHRLIAVTDARNTAAAHLFSRLGFRHEGRAIDADWSKGEWTSLDTWAMLRNEHSQRKSPPTTSSEAFPEALAAGDVPDRAASRQEYDTDHS